jgi:hypothetical protein
LPFSDETVPCREIDMASNDEISTERELQPSKGGRPTKLTPAVQDRIIAAIKAGHHRESAARLGGISPPTLYRWLSADTEPFLTFQAAVEMAEAELEDKVLGVITERIPEDPRLALAYLAKRFPGRWGSGRLATPNPTERAVPPSPPQVNVLVVDRDELEDAAREHLQAHRRRVVAPQLPDEDADDGELGGTES